MIQKTQRDLFKPVIASIFFVIILLLSSCEPTDQDYLYNRIGTDSNAQPTKVAPDYYYRQNQGQRQDQQQMQQGFQGGQQGQGGNPYGQFNGQNSNPYQYPQQYYAPPPYVAAPYQVYPNGGSRTYSNPYAMPPSQYYPQYDADQYYVPPMNYNGIENQQKYIDNPGR